MFDFRELMKRRHPGSGCSDAQRDEVVECAEALLSEQQQQVFRETDRMLALLMVVQWVAGILVASLIAPRTWIGEQSQVLIHVVLAVVVGGVLSGVPVFLARRRAGQPLTRYVITIAQCAWVALLIHLSGGRIEAHFHVFASLAYLACYRDWKVLTVAIVVLASDQIARGVLWPESIYGAAASSLRWMEHLTWLGIEAVLLLISSHQMLRRARDFALRTAELEVVNEGIEQAAAEQTAELQAASERLSAEVRTRELAQAREAELGRIVEESHIEIYVLEPDTYRFVDANAAAIRRLDVSLNSLRLMTIRDIVAGIMPEELDELMARVVGSQTCCSAEYRHRASDGSEYDVEVHLQPVATGDVPRILAWALDITDRKELEAETERMQHELLEVSRAAGMAETATGILHNVGNVLNSVNVSANIVNDRLRQSRVAQLTKATALLEQDDLATFLTEDEKGRRLPGYLHRVSEILCQENDELIHEMHSLRERIDHIKEVVQLQQQYAQCSGTAEPVEPAELLEMAAKVTSSSAMRHEIEVVREYETVAPVITQKHKVLQILVNLLSNAKNAINEHDGPERKIVLHVEDEADTVMMSVHDTGSGIESDHLTRIFAHGFTTRENGHGFGLHSSANTAVELGGSLEVTSDGPGSGARFTLRLPRTPEAALATS